MCFRALTCISPNPWNPGTLGVNSVHILVELLMDSSTKSALQNTPELLTPSLYICTVYLTFCTTVITCVNY